MLNTRKNAREKFEQVRNVHKDAHYISSGITKRHQECILKNIKDNNDSILVSTQVVEAGVDISFSNIWRQLAPLDNIVQILGRLDRENKDEQATLYVFDEGSHIPYSSLEYKTSQEYLQRIENTVQLYDKLQKYYEDVSVKNKDQKSDLAHLEKYIGDLDFELVWDHVQKFLSNDYHDTVYVPDMQEWDNVKKDMLSNPKSAIKKHANMQASLPKRVGEFKGFFDEELMDKKILLPKKDRIGEMYDPITGLDKWIETTA